MEETIGLPPEDVQVTEEYVSETEDYYGAGNTWLHRWRKTFQAAPEPEEAPELRYIDWPRLFIWLFFATFIGLIVFTIWAVFHFIIHPLQAHETASGGVHLSTSPIAGYVLVFGICFIAITKFLRWLKR